MKVAIIESDGQVRDEIEKILKKMDLSYELAGTALNGKDGYELISSEHPDLVIMDIQLPKMNGLSMLKKLRKEQAGCKVLVLTENEDFNDARQAIELGVDSYLLKPVKPAQFRKAVAQIAGKLAEERGMKSTFTIENIFLGCLNGQLHPDETFHEMTMENYGFTVNDKGAVFTVSLGDKYEAEKTEARRLVENAAEAAGSFSAYVIEADVWEALIVLVYRFTDGEPKDTYFRKTIVPLLCSNLQGAVICMWAEMEHLLDVPEVLKTMRKNLEWNLLYDRGELIREDEIEKLEVVPLKYPAEIEAQARQAVLAGKIEELKKCYYRLYALFRQEPYSPEEMKNALIRFNMAAVNAYKTQRELESELQIQKCMQAISESMSWRQMRTAMENFFQVVGFGMLEEVDDTELSTLVRKAAQLARKYYDQGITLEETAGRLFVSVEYLSSQFKKETGMGFTETVRKYRIERIKGLLVSTRLKLNQIAELTGYTDPKYMSRVFKEEVGMLPTEYRKTAH